MSDVELFSQGAAAAPSDARQSARINVSWRARVLISATQFIEGRAINVSETGVGLLLPQAMPVGARLTAAMAVPDSADRSHIIPVTLQIKVVSTWPRAISSRWGARSRSGTRPGAS